MTLFFCQFEFFLSFLTLCQFEFRQTSIMFEKEKRIENNNFLHLKNTVDADDFVSGKFPHENALQ